MLRPTFISAATCSALRFGLPFRVGHIPFVSRTLAFSASRTTAFGGGFNSISGSGLYNNGDGGGGGDRSNFGMVRYTSASSANDVADSTSPTLVKVVSYNVLSSALAKTSQFPYSDPSDLVANVRLNRLFDKLVGPVAERAIICLQEVSLSWSGPLHAYFSKRSFHLVMSSYGSYFNGYMGVAIAFPTDKFYADDIRLQCLADAARWPPVPPQSPVSKFFSGIRHSINSTIAFATGADVKRASKRSRSPWIQARERKNVLIFARLRSRTNGTSLCVGNYHMPCCFWSPAIMLIHSALVVSTFQRLAAGARYTVLAGDFNIKPKDSAYRMITTGAIAPTHADFPPDAPDGSPADKWFPRQFTAMKSAYADVNGIEPEFTNYARQKDSPEFCETLDYLFCSKELDVVDVVPLPERKEVEGPFPIKSEPSDHILIGCTVRLPADSAVSKKKRKQVAQGANIFS